MTYATAELPIASPAEPGTGRFHEVDCIVKSNTAINGEYYLLILSAPPEILDCRPGQFFHLLCPPLGFFEFPVRMQSSMHHTPVHDRATGDV